MEYLLAFAPFLMVIGIVWVRSQAQVEALHDARRIDEQIELGERAAVR